ncbi:MAG: hypothetical protein IKF82_00375 [Bacilli bacterium]|nr:hypothetical protein [Bacilli bacterium]
MNFKTKGEVWKAYKNGKLAAWERDVILERIEFEENLSKIGKVILEYHDLKKEIDRR